MSTLTPIPRGDLMRRIAALYARIALRGRTGTSGEQVVAEREQIEREIAALTKQMMGR